LEKIKIGIKELKKLGCRTEINIVLTKQNYKDLSEIVLYYLDM
jgi:MoaA/NifB/PqqE/SkfB family radical SAM enzyme